MFYLLPLTETHAFHICHIVKIISTNENGAFSLPTYKLITVHAMKQKHNVNIEEYLNMAL